MTIDESGVVHFTPEETATFQAEIDTPQLQETRRFSEMIERLAQHNGRIYTRGPISGYRVPER
jgi:hypothetical protein